MSASLWHVVLLAVYGLSSVTSSPIAGDEKSEEKRSGQCITELYRREEKKRKKKVCSRWEECCLFFVFVLGCCWAFCLFSVLVCVCGGGGGGGVVAVCLLVLGFFVCFFGLFVILSFFGYSPPNISVLEFIYTTRIRHASITI